MSSKKKITINKDVLAEIENIVREHPVKNRVEWTSTMDELLLRYHGKTTYKGLIKILNKLYPDAQFNKNTICKRIHYLNNGEYS